MYSGGKMSIFTATAEYRIRNMALFHHLTRVFNGYPDYQSLLHLGIIAKPNLSDDMDDFADDDDDDYTYTRSRSGLRDWHIHDPYSKVCNRLSCKASHPSGHFCNAVEDEESDSERRERLLLEAKKLKEKAEKKRLKKKRQKERKLTEKMKKDGENPVKKEEEADDSVQRKTVENKPDNDNMEELAVKMATKSRHLSSEKSSEDESEGDSEELDLTSTFVSKAADIARRKLEQKSKTEQKAKKSPVKEKPEKPLEKVKEEPTNSVGPNSPKHDNNVRKSTELAKLGNQFASAGDYNTAIKYFTDAIKYNPTEFKLFGNRSFCFEKMQEYGKALADAELSLGMCPGWVKGLFRKSRALTGLQRYEDAAQALMEVLKVDSACPEASQELKRVQISQLMECGFTREQSSKALIFHGSVEKALEALLSPGGQPGAERSGSHRRQDHPTKEVEVKPNQSVASKTTAANQQPPQELYPIWVGNLVHTVTEATLKNLFKKVGVVHSVKLLSNRRCAFVNFAQQDSCVEAIRRFHGFELAGCQLAVRYPDRIPKGMGFSKSALKSDDLRDEDGGRNSNGRDGSAGKRLQRP